MDNLNNSENILMQFPCNPRLLDMRIVALFAIQLILGVLDGIASSSAVHIDYSKLGYALLSILDIIGYILLIPLAYFIYNTLSKPLSVTMFLDTIEFKYLFNRKKRYSYKCIKEIAKEREIEHLTLTLLNKKQITLCVGSVPLEVIDQFITELQNRNNILSYCTFDSDNNLLREGAP